METYTNKEWKELANRVHKGKYDYSKTNYVNAKTKVTITCPIHGDFEQLPRKHMSGQGCPQCKIDKITHLRKKTLEEVKQQAKAIYGDKYDLSNIKYVNSHSEIELTCPIHGKFHKIVSSFLRGYDCPECMKEKAIKNLTYTQDKVIEMAKAVHGDKYIYDESEYKNMLTKMKIICPKHGEFWQTPAKHIHSKQGCPKCKASHLESEMMLFLEKQNIPYIYQCGRKTFNWLNMQTLDFYLPQHNVAIECQGSQHYQPYSFTNDKCEKEMEVNFKVLKKLDEKKKKLCEDNKLKLIYFTHMDNVKEDENTFKTTENLMKEIIKSKCLLD